MAKITQGPTPSAPRDLTAIKGRLNRRDACNVLVIGSSTMAGYGAAAGLGLGDRLANSLLSYYNNPGTYTNRAVNGAWALDYITGGTVIADIMALSPAMQLYAPRVVIYQSNFRNPTDTRGLNITDYAAQSRAVVDAAYAAGADSVIVLSPNISTEFYNGRVLLEPYREAARLAYIAAGAIYVSLDGAVSLTNSSPYQPDTSLFLDTLHMLSPGIEKALVYAMRGVIAALGVSPVRLRNSLFSSDGSSALDTSYSSNPPSPAVLLGTASATANGTVISGADGTAIRVPVTNRALVFGTHDIAIECLYNASANGANAIIWCRFNTVVGSDYVFIIAGSSQLSVVLGGTSTSVGTAGQWNGAYKHLIISANAGSSTANVYLNGALLANVPIGASRTESGLDWLFGSRFDSAGNPVRGLPGTIRQYGISNSYVGAFEAAALYVARKAQYPTLGLP